MRSSSEPSISLYLPLSTGGKVCSFYHNFPFVPLWFFTSSPSSVRRLAPYLSVSPGVDCRRTIHVWRSQKVHSLMNPLLSPLLAKSLLVLSSRYLPHFACFDLTPKPQSPLFLYVACGSSLAMQLVVLFVQVLVGATRRLQCVGGHWNPSVSSRRYSAWINS